MDKGYIHVSVIIPLVPNCSEPFQTLGMMFEEQEDKAKALQVFCEVSFVTC